MISQNQQTSRFLFLFLLGIQACFFGYLICNNRLPILHDTFFYLCNQYFFLNHAVEYNSIPLWIPYLTHGVVGNLLYFNQAALFQKVLLLMTPLLHSINFLPLFYLNIFVDELVLAVGAWLLARRFFSSPYSALFVVLAVLGSSIWIDQIYFNLKFYYAVPLILHLLHLFFEKKQWRFFGLAGNLLALQMLGGPIYFIPVTTMFIFIYFLCCALFNWQAVATQARKFRFGLPAVCSLLLILLSFFLISLVIFYSSNQTFLASTDRNPNGALSLAMFLGQKHIFGIKNVFDMFAGTSLTFDLPLYIGIITLVFAGVGMILDFDRRKYVCLSVLLIMELFRSGTWVSEFFYFLWPAMKYYNYLESASVFIKILLCFLAGFGFESLFIRQNHGKIPISGFILLTFLLSIVFLLCGLNKNVIDLCLRINYHTSSIVTFSVDQTKVFIRDRLLLSSLSCFMIAVASYIKRFAKSERKKAAICFLVIILHAADLFTYKYMQFEKDTQKLNKQQMQILQFQNIAFANHRGGAGTPARAAIFNDLRLLLYSARYNIIDAFLFIDQLDSTFRVDYWLSSFDKLLMTFDKISNKNQDSNGVKLLTKRRALILSKNNANFFKLAGATEPKIQFFSNAYLIYSEDEIASKIADPEYKADILFVSPLKQNDNGWFHRTHHSEFAEKSPISQNVVDKPLSANERLNLRYLVNYFDSNQIKISVDSPAPAWLYYSDNYYPDWRATINEKPVPLYKANLTYKAIPLESGKNNVHIYYESRLMHFLTLIFGLNSLFWLGMIFYFVRIIFSSNRFDAEPESIV